MTEGHAAPPSVAEGAEAPTSAAKLFSGLRIVSLLTLLSRVLGLVRDIGMAALFGNGAVLDAFSVAFRIPNLARGVFGEGALSTAFLPVFIRERSRNGAAAAWKLASAVFASLGAVLGLCVLVGELALWAVWTFADLGTEAHLLVGLTAVMLPYLVLVCLVAQVGAVLHAWGHFAWPAFAPAILNLVWLAALWLLAPLFESHVGKAYALAACITAAGVLQLAAPQPLLRRLGFRFDRAWRSAGPELAEVARAMLPVVVGLSITQINALSDSLVAWGFSRPVGGPAQMALPGHPTYPLEAGTASALYFGQRMYQFPLGFFGVALGTVLFPVLAQHADQGRLDRLREDLVLGLKLVLAIGLPAGLGLVLLAEPLTALLFQYGAFDAADARQTADMTAAYGIAVWAYCGLLIVHRGYYALGDRTTPLRIGLWAAGLNLMLNLTLIWFVGGVGLAAATSLAAMLQAIAATWFIQQHVGRFGRGNLGGALLRTSAATAIMGAACLGTLYLLPRGTTLVARGTAVAAPMTAAILAYFTAVRWLGIDEVWLLFSRRPHRAAA